MPFQTIHLEIDNRIATLTLTLASSGNAIDERAAFEIRDACERLRQDDDVWVVVLTGEGGSFCIGTAASAFEGQDEDGLTDALRSLRVAESVAAIEKPLIAAIDGNALDQGLEIALACDIRIASEEAMFGMTQVEKGIIPWDGGTQRLPRLVGRGAAAEMILTSLPIDSYSALETGLVNEVVASEDVLNRARALALAIARQGPIAARYVKELILSGQDMTLEQGLRLEGDLNFILQSTTDRAEGIASFLEKRDPQYRSE